MSKKRPPPMPTPAEVYEARQLEAHQNLAKTLENQLDALEAPFCAAYNEVESIVGDWMEEQGFNKGPEVTAKLADIALMHTELSEAAEAIRKANAPKRQNETRHFVSSTDAPPPGLLDPIAEELADCIIRIMHFGAQHGYDVSGALIGKAIANLQRPFKHGKLA